MFVDGVWFDGFGWFYWLFFLKVSLWVVVNVLLDVGVVGVLVVVVVLVFVVCVLFLVFGV